MTNDYEKLELYKVAVEMADRMSARRMAGNTFFITLASLFSGGLGTWIGDSQGISLRSAVALGSITSLITLLWWMQIRSYRNISTAKFKVIHELELGLQSAPFTKEWEWITQERKKHFDLTQTEQFIPILFLVIAGALIISAVK